jgi:phage tail sheath protein FI
MAIGQSGDVYDHSKVDSIHSSHIMLAEDFGYANSSYQELICNWTLTTDPTSGRDVWLPNVVFLAATIARTDVTANVWNAPSGQIRGVIPGKAQRFELSDDEIGKLYDNNINSPKEFMGIGACIWGQKTAQRKPSALDRVNVRRTLLFIEATVKGFLNPLVLDVNNTPEVRLRVWSQINNFLSSVKTEGGLTDYQVICDESNNTAAVIDANTLNVDILVKPVKTIEFIDVNVLIGNSGADFSELRVR